MDLLDVHEGVFFHWPADTHPLFLPPVELARLSGELPELHPPELSNSAPSFL